MLKLLIGSIAAGSAVGAVASGAAASVLFNRTIPRQDTLKVDISEFADMEKWEEYKKFITPRHEWLVAKQPEEIYIKARDGVLLHAWYLPSEKPTDRIVIGNHGYTSCGMNDFSSHSYFFHQLGFDCLIPDHRAHGKSEGDYVGFGILDRFDCISWIRYIEKRFGKDKRILLHGTSMGASTVLMASGFPDFPDSVKGIISDCAFTSPHDIFSHILKRDYHLPEFPILNISDGICRKKAGYGFDDYSTLTAMKTEKCPILFIHGSDDKFVPTEMSRQNYAACKSPKELLIVENAGHGSSYYENVKQYEEAEINFINNWIPENND